MRTMLRPALLFLVLLAAAGAAHANTGSIAGVQIAPGPVANNAAVQVTVSGTGTCAYKFTLYNNAHSYTSNLQTISTLPKTFDLNLGGLASGIAAGSYNLRVTPFPAYAYPCGNDTQYVTSAGQVAVSAPPASAITGISFAPSTGAPGAPMSVTIAGHGKCTFAIATNLDPAAAQGPASHALPYTFQVTPSQVGNFSFSANPVANVPYAELCAPGDKSANLTVAQGIIRPDLRIEKISMREHDVEIPPDNSGSWSWTQIWNFERAYGVEWIVSNIGILDSLPTKVTVTCNMIHAQSTLTRCWENPGGVRTFDVPALKHNQSVHIKFEHSDFVQHRKMHKMAYSDGKNLSEDTGVIVDKPGYSVEIKAHVGSGPADTDTANNSATVKMSAPNE